MRREYAQIVKKKSFLVGVFLMPVLMTVFMLAPAYFMRQESPTAQHMVILDRGSAGIADEFSRLIKTYKINDTERSVYVVDSIVRFEVDESERLTEVLDQFRPRIADQELRYLLVIDGNPLDSGSALYLVTNTDDYIATNRFESKLSYALSTRRLERSNVNLPVDSVMALTGRIDLRTQTTKGESISSEVKLITAFIFGFLVYMMIIVYGTNLLRSVIEEKNSRIIEVLLSSVSSFQLMMGKIVGHSFATITTVGIWVVFGLALIFSAGAYSLELDPSLLAVAFNPVVLIVFALALTFGYTIYSSLFAILGSILNNDSEAQNYIFPIVIVVLVPVVMTGSIVRDPYATWVQVMALIPVFTPTIMTARVVTLAPTAESYSLFSGIVGESILSFVILVLGTIGMIWIAGRIFRVGILMTGKRPTFAEIVKWVRQT
jgi:ABC-2 type transport system permease protein